MIHKGDLLLDMPAKAEHVTDIKIEQKMGEHASAYIKAVLENADEKSIHEITAQSAIRIKARKKRAEQELFCGLVRQAQLSREGGVYQITLRLGSMSEKMDKKVNSRSFQDKTNPYKQIFSEITAKYGGDILDSASRGKAQGMAIIQYRETDWAFLKRIASHVQAAIYPKVTGERIQVYVGVHPGDTYEEKELNYEIEKDLSQYRRCKEATEEWKEEQSIAYTLETDEWYELGDKVIYEGIKLVICEKTTYLEKNILMSRYTLKKEAGLRQAKYGNEKITGASIGAKVLEVEKDRVKLHLDIDEKQDSGKAFWYQYDTAYQAVGRTGWYVMPQIGDRVNLYIPQEDEASAAVKNTIRTDGKSNPKTQNPGIKYFGTVHGSELKMSADELTMHQSENKMYLKATHAGGVEITSAGDIRLRTEAGVLLECSGKMSIQAGKNIQLIAKGANVIMDEKVHLKG